MDGPTATRAIRELGYTGRIFGVTGNGDVQQFTDSGVERVLMKPFSIPEFQAALVSRPQSVSPSSDNSAEGPIPTAERISPLPSHTAATATTPAAKVRTVLVVEDNTMNRKMLVKLFNSVGQVVEEAVNGQDAVNKVKKRRSEGLSEFDAILMDFTMVRAVCGCTGQPFSLSLLVSLSLSLSVLIVSLHLSPSLLFPPSLSWTVPRRPAPSVF